MVTFGKRGACKPAGHGHKPVKFWCWLPDLDCSPGPQNIGDMT